MSTYGAHAAICIRFYELTNDWNQIGPFVYMKSRSKPNDRSLFVGSFFEVAQFLFSKGLDLTVVDYSDEMVEAGRSKLPDVKMKTADLRSLPFENEFDSIFVIGRVFTHMISEDDLRLALTSCRRALKKDGRFFFDNYEDSRIQHTSYFNGAKRCGSSDSTIERTSSTAKESDKPFIVRWNATYTGTFQGENFSFSDSMLHRAFSRNEIAALLPEFGFETMEQGNNFDETSFYTLARAR